ncbi:MAG: hypothetical protein IT324_30230 [Anaerolineae bacterium]|nr:hypothetical protein [Anaerolineae bacterium]
MEQLPLFEVEGEPAHDGSQPSQPEPKPVRARVAPPIPAEVIVAAVELMGGIDLDPYCVDETTTLIPAKHHYSTDEGALAHPWGSGVKRLRVFLSPPAGRATAAWVNKLCDEYEAGSVAQAILYLRAALDTEWWQRLMSYPICIVRRQLRDAAGKRSTTSPWAVVYLGANLKGFAEAFSEVGTLYAPFKRQPPLAETEPVRKPAPAEHSPVSAPPRAAKPAREKSGGVQTFQQGDYEVTVHATACYLTLANPHWDTRDQLRLRKAILNIPDMLPRQYSRVSKEADGSVKLVFSFKQGQAQKIASRVKKLLVDPSAKAAR